MVWNADDIEVKSASEFRISLDPGQTTQIDGSANYVWLTNNLVVNRTYRFLKVLLDAGSGPKQTARPDRGRFQFFPVETLATASLCLATATEL